MLAIDVPQDSRFDRPVSDPEDRVRAAVRLRMTEQAVRSQADLARRAGTTPDTIGDFLNGKRWPHDDTLARIEAALAWPAGHIRALESAASPGVSPTGEGVLLDLPEGAFDGFSVAEREEALAAGKTEILRKAREIRRAIDQGL